MKNHAIVRSLFPSQLAALVLASALGIPAMAQQAQPAGDVQNTPPAAAEQQSLPPAAPYVAPAKEGFWGRVNPFARKSWVKKQTDPINNRLSELDEVNAKNARDIQDVDRRAQAGISKAQASADAANQTATAAGAQAQTANGVAMNASGHVDQLNATVNGLDKYHQVTDVNIAFRHGSPVLSADAKKQLDDLAATMTGHEGYIVEMEAQSPHAGSAGIQSSQRLAESVERYLVTEHQIPVYRMHFVALGNVEVASTGNEDSRPVRTSNVHVRLMENSLAAQGVASPQGVTPSTGADRQ
ncbi:MAG TPA: OmpA family protein [Terracidiphilus sp.]|nr:OmpA family protein [Terracidiphilus sp.]